MTQQLTEPLTMNRSDEIIIDNIQALPLNIKDFKFGTSYNEILQLIITISDDFMQVHPQRHKFKEFPEYDFYFGISSSGVTHFGCLYHDPNWRPPNTLMWSSNAASASIITGIPQASVHIIDKNNFNMAANMTVEAINKLILPNYIMENKAGVWSAVKLN